jgi:hypothetical protein
MLLKAWVPTLLPASVALPAKVTVSPLMALVTLSRLAAAVVVPSYTRVAPATVATAIGSGVTVSWPLAYEML